MDKDVERRVIDLEAKLRVYALALEIRDARIVKLVAQIEDLKRQLKLDSTNSSKPPGSDGFRKKPSRQSLRTKSGKPSGGQPGHEGSTLKQIMGPDKIELHPVTTCPYCTADLQPIAVDKIIKRQVFDLPASPFEVTEHQAEIKRCPCCGKEVAGTFPSGVCAPAQYGRRIQGHVIYFLHQQLIPEDRLQMLFQDLFNMPISTATIAHMSEQFADEVTPLMDAVAAELRDAPVKHLDETGLRVAGKLHWLHGMSHGKGTIYRVETKRGAIPQGLTGTVVHDHFKPYYTLENVLHGLCGTHLLRELKALIEIEKEPWAMQMSRLLVVVCRLSNRKKAASATRIAWIHRLYDNIVAQGIQFHEVQPALTAIRTCGRKKRRVGHNLLIRLRDYQDDVLRCLSDPTVPFTNNQIEQDLRMMKVKQKISGGFRTLFGARVFAMTRSFLSTVRKHGFNVFQAVLQPSLLNVPLGIPPPVIG